MRERVCSSAKKAALGVKPLYNPIMKSTFTAIIERDPQTGLLVGYVPGFPGAHSQGATLDELQDNLREVIAMLLEDGPPEIEGEFLGTQTVTVD